MSTPQINGIVIPSSMAHRARTYDYDVPIIGKNGEKEPVALDHARLLWTWDILSDTEMAWWVTTLLGGELYLNVSGAGTTKLYNKWGTLTDHDSCKVYQPTYKVITGNSYLQVTVFIDNLVVST